MNERITYILDESLDTYVPESLIGNLLLPHLITLTTAINNQTEAVNRLIEQNAILIESLCDMDEGEDPTSYLDGGSLNG